MCLQKRFRLKDSRLDDAMVQCMLTYTHIHPIHPGGVKILTLHGPSASPPQKETRTDGRKRNVAVNRNTTHALQSSREREGGLNKVRLLLLLSGTLQKKKGESFSGRIIPHRKPFGRHADALIASTIVLFVLVGRGGGHGVKSNARG
jgi:hypothetical protein